MVKEKENIDELLSRYFSGESLPEEAMYVHDWKDESEENRLYFESCEKMFHGHIDKAKIQKGWGNVKAQINNPKKPKSIITLWRAAAAVLVLVGIASAIYFMTNAGNSSIQYMASTDSVHAVLSDGTDIILSPHSQLIVANEFGDKKRNLYLKGSAYFSVIHKEEAPFIVDAGGVFIKDIGTKFFIQTSLDTDTVHVRVDEGIVLLFDSLHEEVEIKAGNSAMYVKSIGKIIPDPSKINEHIELSFSDMKLADIVQKLSLDYRVKIEIANPALNNCMITSQFKNEKLETILSVITETLNISYTKTDSGYIISGERCNQ